MQATISPELREAFRFHLEHAGYRTPPGRAACALESARAELRLMAAIEAGTARVRHVADDVFPDGDALTPDEWQEQIDRYGCIGVVIETRAPACPCCGNHPGEWEHAASLWSVIGDSDYHRVIAAELAGEVFDVG